MEYRAVAKRTNAEKPESFDFEQALADLEQLVERMEHGELTLEESLKDFERGIALTRSCQKALAEAEQKVKMLVQKNGIESLESLEPFEPDEG